MRPTKWTAKTFTSQTRRLTSKSHTSLYCGRRRKRKKRWETPTLFSFARRYKFEKFCRSLTDKNAQAHAAAHFWHNFSSFKQHHAPFANQVRLQHPAANRRQAARLPCRSAAATAKGFPADGCRRHRSHRAARAHRLSGKGAKFPFENLLLRRRSGNKTEKPFSRKGHFCKATRQSAARPCCTNWACPQK